MILSDREIRAARERGAVRINPMPAPAAWSSTAVDLTLESPLSCWRIPGGKRSRIVIAPHSPDYDFASLTEQFGQEVSLPAKGHIVEPFSFLLGWTVERIQLPHQSRIAARVEGKSSLARLGLGVHVTAPTIHSGFGWTGDPNYLGTAIVWRSGTSGPFGSSWRKGCRSVN